MNRISIELVPRDEASLREGLTVASRVAARAGVINIPDLLRLPMRSWEGAAIAKEYFASSMPHIRAMDIDLKQELPMKEFLRAHDIREVLVIEGDPPQDMLHEVYPTETVDVIRKFHEEMPEVKVFAGIDQYRSSMRRELYRAERKLQAGAAGFFTQPFFDMRYLGMYADALTGTEVYWGVSPVMTARSKSYWERKNSVIFPKGFEPGLEWSVNFSREVLGFCEGRGESIYIMPIKAGLEEYLTGVFA